MLEILTKITKGQGIKSDLDLLEEIAFTVKNMVRNKRLSKSISDVSWSEFRRMLDYKSKWYGRELIIAPTFYESSQLCSSCGNQSNQTKDLGCRTYVCPTCGMVMDRDLNASKNLLKLAD